MLPSSTKNLFVTLLLAPFCLFILFLNRKRVIRHSCLSSIQQMFSPSGASLGDMLASRSQPNQRLVRAFGIRNTFVSADQDIHRHFVSAANSLLTQANKRGWVYLRDLAAEAIELELTFVDPSSHRLSYSTFVQCVTLRVILAGLVDPSTSIMDFAREDIITTTTLINELWTLSKGPAPIPCHLNHQLSVALQRLVPESTSFSNPLDIVIPAWETFWRVVATTVAFSCSHHDSMDVFSTLHQSPTVATFKGAPAALSPKHVADEAMRLRPPSKHIGRAKTRWIFNLLRSLPLFIRRHLPTSVPFNKEYADIQSILMSPSIWGLEADAFNPWRHTIRGTPEEDRRREQALSYIFGGGKLRCIGAAWAPMAAAVVAGAVLEVTTGDSPYQIVQGMVVGGREGWDDWSIEEKI